MVVDAGLVGGLGGKDNGAERTPRGSKSDVHTTPDLLTTSPVRLLQDASGKCVCRETEIAELHQLGTPTSTVPLYYVSRPTSTLAARSQLTCLLVD
jgi:hypothetical protein